MPTAKWRVGQATGLLFFGLTLIVAGMLFGLLDPHVTGPIKNAAANQTTSTAADTGQNYVFTYWDNLPFVLAFAGFFQIVVWAVVQSRVGGVR